MYNNNEVHQKSKFSDFGKNVQVCLLQLQTIHRCHQIIIAS